MIIHQLYAHGSAILLILIHWARLYAEAGNSDREDSKAILVESELVATTVV